MYVPPTLVPNILDYFHTQPVSGNLGIYKFYHTEHHVSFWAAVWTFLKLYVSSVPNIEKWEPQNAYLVWPRYIVHVSNLSRDLCQMKSHPEDDYSIASQKTDTRIEQDLDNNPEMGPIPTWSMVCHQFNVTRNHWYIFSWALPRKKLQWQGPMDKYCMTK